MERRCFASLFDKKIATKLHESRLSLKQLLIARRPYAIFTLMKYKTEPAYSHEKPSKTGVLLVNLGTPTALNYRPMRRYLSQFLMDPRIVEMNRAKWWLILNGILLNFIPQRSARGYAKIWNRDKNDSPLRLFSYAQKEALQKEFDPELVHVELGMRYGTPSIESAITRLKEAKCSKILVVPLYPQYCAATTASACDEVFRVLRKIRWMPSVRTAPPYHKHPEYIKALASSVKEHTKDKPFDVLLASYHGIPEKYFKNGDPYPCHCHKTTSLLKEELGLPDEKIKLAYQSKFGRDKWLEPSTSDTLESLPQKGIKNIAVITPGFSVDCIETLEEIAMEGKEEFIENGGEHFTFIPCLNDSEDGMKVIKAICENELKGWV
jgi:ferrochelatase